MLLMKIILFPDNQNHVCYKISSKGFVEFWLLNDKINADNYQWKWLNSSTTKFLLITTNPATNFLLPGAVFGNPSACGLQIQFRRAHSQMDHSTLFTLQGIFHSIPSNLLFPFILNLASWNLSQWWCYFFFFFSFWTF